MTHERLERRLASEPAPDELDWVARPLPMSVADARARVTSTHGPHRGLLAMVAVVVVAIVAVGAWSVGSTLLATSPREVGNGSVASPTPTSAAPAIVACTAEDFAVASDPWDSAAGSRGTTVVLRVVDSTAACDLPGGVTARITDASGTSLVEGASDPVARERIEQGTQLELGIAWSNWCDAQPGTPLTLELLLDGDATWIPVVAPGGTGPLVPPCMGSGQATNLSVTGFQPSERPPIEG